MISRKLLLSSTALVFSASTAFAEINAQNVWQDWKDYMNNFGYTVEGSEATSGDTLTVSGLKLSIPVPEEEGSVNISMGEMNFTNLSDGSVEINLPETLPIAFSFASEGEKDVSGVLNYDNKDLSIIVSGSPDDMTYTYTAAALDMTVSDLVIEGKPMDIGTMAFNMAGVAGKTGMKIGNIRDVVQNFTAEKLSYTFDITPPEDTDELDNFKMTGALNALTFNGTGAYPNDGSFDAQNISALLKAGFAFDGSFGYTGGMTNVEITEDGQQTIGSSSSDSGMLKVAMDEGGLAYSGEALGLKSTMTGGQIPFPVEINAEKSAFALAMPITASEEEQDYGFTIELSNFTTSEMLWGMIDPTGQLPRDPATLHLDLSGKAKLLFDMMDPEGMASIETGEKKPGEVNSVNINTINLSIAGAALTGEGAFTFDNSDMETIPGMPKPTGAVDLKLVGGNGLIDKLVGMGLLPEEQAMGARMMMGLFAVPGEAPDTLNSKIEVNEQGHVLANGQRLK
jgi:Uncharacterized protein conserved in bacteria (DUF2125)